LRLSEPLLSLFIKLALVKPNPKISVKYYMSYKCGADYCALRDRPAMPINAA